MEPALFSPMAAQVLLILVGAISVVALVGIAYTYSLTVSNRRRLAKVESFEQSIKTLQQEVKELEGQIKKTLNALPSKEEGVAAKPLAIDNAAVSKVKQEVWQSFVDDYNNLANSMNVPKAAEACEHFVQNNKVQLLICVIPHEEIGETPVYDQVDNVEDSKFWAWNVTGKPNDFIVVPNPMIEYNEKMHNQEGMKETFASNYECGKFKQIQVKLPAHFICRQGTWKIVQPGVIRVK